MTEAYLEVLDATGSRVVPVRRHLRIGSGPSADLLLDDSSVGRRHAIVVCGSAGVTIVDNRSATGVTVNGRKVLAAPLHDGDEIGIGNIKLRFAEAAAIGAAA